MTSSNKSKSKPVASKLENVVLFVQANIKLWQAVTNPNQNQLQVNWKTFIILLVASANWIYISCKWFVISTLLINNCPHSFILYLKLNISDAFPMQYILSNLLKILTESLLLIFKKIECRNFFDVEKKSYKKKNHLFFILFILFFIIFKITTFKVF